MYVPKQTIMPKNNHFYEHDLCVFKLFLLVNCFSTKFR